MRSKLFSLCLYVNGKVAVNTLDKTNYISTENMLPNKGGVERASVLPSVQYTQAYSKGDVLVSNIRPYFKKIWQAEFDGGCSNDVLVFRANGGCDPTFLYYVLANDAFFDYATATSKGTKMPRGDKTAIMQYVVPDFDKDTQKRISGLLRCLDKQIATNKKINDNLQQQARAIYKEWFIDFGSTSGTTPDTWKHGKLKDVLQLHKRAIKSGANTTLPYLPIDTIPMQSFGVTEFRPNDEAKSSLITFQKDDIIVGAMRVYFHRVVLAPCDGITRTTCFTLSPYNSKYLSYALLTCDLDSSIDHAQNTSKGSTMPYAVWDGGMGEIEIVIPPIDVAEEFNNSVLPMLRQIQRNCEEIQILGNLRDTLLPKLMSGEIDVSDVKF